MNAQTVKVCLFLLASGCQERRRNVERRIDAEQPVDVRTPKEEARLDCSSDEALKRSLALVRAHMDDPTSKELEISIMAITLEKGSDIVQAQKAIHGKTAREVIEYAKSLK